jgi:uncharacterized membrane protein
VLVGNLNANSHLKTIARSCLPVKNNHFADALLVFATGFEIRMGLLIAAILYFVVSTVN